MPTSYLPFRRIPVVGKHSRKIQSGCWSSSNLLALGGEDKILTISSSEGDTLRTTPLRGEPSDIQFSEMKQDERAMSENTVSILQYILISTSLERAFSINTEEE